MKRKCLPQFLMLVFILMSYDGYTQKSMVTTKNTIEVISKYRADLLHVKANTVNHLKRLLDKWESYNSSELDQLTVTTNVLFSKLILGNTNNEIQKQALKYLPESKIAHNLTTSDIDIICNNSELLDLIHLGILKSSYPFVINPNSCYLKELIIYDINSNDKISDIGCGSGMFGFLINKIEPDAEVYLNELNIDYLKFILETRKSQSSDQQNGNIKLIEGTIKSTNLEGYKIDKVIIRNTFHHFRKKRRMLNSIKNTLSENGFLFILEEIGEYDDDGDICKDAMNSKQEIIEIVTSYGFHLLEEFKLDEEILLKFEVNKKMNRAPDRTSQ